MKGLVLILFLLNLAVGGFFLGKTLLATTQPAAHPPLNIDRISLRSASRPKNPGARLPESPASRTLCVEWRGVEQADFVRAREQLKQMTGDHVMSFTEVPLSLYQWVVFPPLPSRSAALAKLAELAALGIEDVGVVQDGVWTNALSLGLYMNVEAARRRTRELEDKGIHGTRIETQPKPGTGYYFLIRSDDADALKSLNEAKTAYPSSTLSRVACDAGLR